MINIKNILSLAKHAINYIFMIITNYYKNCNILNILFYYNKYKKYFFS